MNERIKELAEQAEAYADEKSGAFRGEMFMRCFTEKFYELVRQDEREACAKLCDLVAREADDTDGLATYIGKSIRARGDKNESRSNN